MSVHRLVTTVSTSALPMASTCSPLTKFPFKRIAFVPTFTCKKGTSRHKRYVPSCRASRFPLSHPLSGNGQRELQVRCRIFHRWLPHPSDRRTSPPSRLGCTFRRIPTVRAFSSAFWKDIHSTCSTTTIHVMLVDVPFTANSHRHDPASNHCWFCVTVCVLWS